jgi:hypothetical protein
MTVGPIERSEIRGLIFSAGPGFRVARAGLRRRMNLPCLPRDQSASEEVTMTQDATASIDRLTVRIAQLETANIALSGIVATVVAIAIFVVGGVTLSHAARANAAQHSISSCATAKAGTPCPARKLPFSQRIISA